MYAINIPNVLPEVETKMFVDGKLFFVTLHRYEGGVMLEEEMNINDAGIKANGICKEQAKSKMNELFDASEKGSYSFTHIYSDNDHDGIMIENRPLPEGNYRAWAFLLGFASEFVEVTDEEVHNANEDSNSHHEENHE